MGMIKTGLEPRFPRRLLSSWPQSDHIRIAGWNRRDAWSRKAVVLSSCWSPFGGWLELDFWGRDGMPGGVRALVQVPPRAASEGLAALEVPSMSVAPSMSIHTLSTEAGTAPWPECDA